MKNVFIFLFSLCFAASAYSQITVTFDTIGNYISITDGVSNRQIKRQDCRATRLNDNIEIYASSAKDGMWAFSTTIFKAGTHTIPTRDSVLYYVNQKYCTINPVQVLADSIIVPTAVNVGNFPDVQPVTIVKDTTLSITIITRDTIGIDTIVSGYSSVSINVENNWTGKINGKSVYHELSPWVFNAPPSKLLPQIIIETTANKKINITAIK